MEEKTENKEVVYDGDEFDICGCTCGFASYGVNAEKELDEHDCPLLP